VRRVAVATNDLKDMGHATVKEDAPRTSAQAELADPTNPVIPSLSLAALFQQHAAILERVERMRALYEEIATIAERAGFGHPHRLLVDDRSARCTLWLAERGGSEHMRKHLDAGAWGYLMEQSGLRSFMDAKARAAWDQCLTALAAPPLTEASVRATFERLHEERNAMFERGVIEVFRSLSGHYRTNRPVAFGKRLVLRGMTGNGLLYTNASCADELDDLERAMRILDGTLQEDHRRAWYLRLSNAIHARQRLAMSEYLQIRLFLNGNGHVTFLRTDLVDRLNLILAKHFGSALADDRR
jgi:hypothetical protein